jgi:hypothetical protein
MTTSTQSGGSGRRPSVSIACDTPGDPRLAAFAEYLDAFDRVDHKGSTLASRRLRAMGFSVCLVAPRDDRRGA